MIQLRFKMNSTDTGQGDSQKLKDVEMFQENTDEPGIDYRDPDTVWVWIRNDLCVELTKDMVDVLQEGFVENFPEEDDT